MDTKKLKDKSLHKAHRPREITDDVVNKVICLRENYTWASIAEATGFSERGLQNALKRYKDSK
ncbi:hypothetical protein Q5H80_03030 [Vibrio sp. SNU_ST1]|uniref:hypothetical protein n=1 Tax=Vibrio sp. SNU_ST1 TaxID=3064001 RepID=UPI00272AA636|nr:hypothetical protein [Vibrio sp. SNU_ST1]WKY58639.1 hypothetical protein Q5H80_03030 [Vibrio sp. SNU_ST1]